MKTMKMIALSATAMALVACSGGEKEPEMMPEEMPANQEELAPAPEPADTTMEEAPAAPEAKAGEPGSVAPTEKMEDRMGSQMSTDAPIKSTDKKSKTSTVPVVEEAQPVAAEDAAPVKTTTKKKR